MCRRVAAAKRASHVAVDETQVPLTMLKTMKLLLQQWRTLNAEHCGKSAGSDAEVLLLSLRR